MCFFFLSPDWSTAHYKAKNQTAVKANFYACTNTHAQAFFHVINWTVCGFIIFIIVFFLLVFLQSGMCFECVTFGVAVHRIQVISICWD